MNAVMRPVEYMDPAIINKLVLTGDLASLTPQQQTQYYSYRCQQAGLDPAAKPFDLLKLNGRLVLYANASCTQQLCGIHKLRTSITAREKVEDIYTVCARVESPDGRFSENMGAVPIGSLKGEALANALLKATTKAIRRTVLAHVGLGMLDETEVATIPGATRIDVSADPRGDLTGVDTAIRDKHVSAITDILATESTTEEETQAQHAQMLQDYVAEFLHGHNELFIAVADELAALKVCTKAHLKALLKVGR